MLELVAEEDVRELLVEDCGTELEEELPGTDEPTDDIAELLDDVVADETDEAMEEDDEEDNGSWQAQIRLPKGGIA